MDTRQVIALTDVERLRTADPFDRAFLETTIEHHRSAVAAAEVMRSKRADPEIEALAADINESQQAEITQLEAWHAAWYPG